MKIVISNILTLQYFDLERSPPLFPYINQYKVRIKVFVVFAEYIVKYIDVYYYIYQTRNSPQYTLLILAPLVGFQSIQGNYIYCGEGYLTLVG